MSLIMKGSAAASAAPIPEGTHLGVCGTLIDLGVQYSETWKTSARKVLIGWEIPGETVEAEGQRRPRTLCRIYTASLAEGTGLRRDLAAWRGRDFSPEEAENFDLRAILGTSCLLEVVRGESGGRPFARVKAVRALPKGVGRAALSGTPLVYDIDADPPGAADALPPRIRDMVVRSESYRARLEAAALPAGFTEEADEDAPLPF